MDNIDGIPVVWDDADKLFGSLFPDGVAQGMQGFAGVQLGGQKPEYVSPFMEMNGVATDTNSITNQATSQFACTGADQDGNATYQYLVATIPCDDGAKVYSTYESTSVEPHELYLFYEKEKPDKNNLFGDFYIAKMGDSFSGIIRNFLDADNKYSIPGTIKGEAKATAISSYGTLTTYVNKVALGRHADELYFNSTHNAIEREYLSKTPTGKLYEGLNSIDEIIAKGLGWCADGLEGLMIQEKSYIPSSNYKPIIGQSRNSIGAENLVVDLFEEAVNSPFGKEAEAAISEAYSYIVTTLNNLGKAIYDQLPEPVKNVIRKLQLLVQQLKAGLDTILEYVGNFLKLVGALVKEVLQLINAFLCGIINGLISTVQVIIRILAFLVDMTGMDNDYKSYLRRRDLGEKIESVFDFITESFSSMVEGVINLFKPPYNTTAADIKRFIQSIGSFFEKIADGAVDFFKNTSRFKFAYWAGIFVFEVIINVLLAIFTAGGGNAVKAAGSFTKILGREMISVATLGVVDILAFFKSLIGAFVRACKRGLKGFLRWVEELIKGIKKGNAKSVDELLEDAEKAVGGRGPLGIGEIIGEYSKRAFNPEKAGGKILNLFWQDAKITKDGIAIVKKHISRFDDVAANRKMIERLEKIEKGELQITDWDKRFYTHETREFERYKNLGYENTKNDLIPDEVWNDAHSATLEDYKLFELDSEGQLNLYHPDIKDIDFHY